MKWQNIDAGEGYYYITGTLVEWQPLFYRTEVRDVLIQEIRVALRRYSASLAAFVIMPEHVHLLLHLPSKYTLHKFCKCWRGRSARRIIDYFVMQGEQQILDIFAKHANGKCKYSAWKEQPRALAIYTTPKLREKIDYIHANPVRRGLVQSPEEWPHSSYQFYEREEQAELDLIAPDL